MKTMSTRLVMAAGAAALLWAGRAVAQQAGGTSGGPGTLGTEMPSDSAVARSYSNYSIRSGSNTRRVQEGVQELHERYQAIIQAATQAQAGASADQKKAAQKLIDDAQRGDENLLALASQDEGFPLTEEQARMAARGGAGTGQGPSGQGGGTFSDNLPQNAGPTTASSGSSPTARGTASASAGTGAASTGAGAGDPAAALAEANRLCADASEHAGDLARAARADSRPQLASFLDRAKRTLRLNGP